MAFFMLMFGCALVIQNRTEVLIYYGGSDLLVLQYFYTAVVYRCSEWLEGGMFCDDKRAGVAFTWTFLLAFDKQTAESENKIVLQTRSFGQ